MLTATIIQTIVFISYITFILIKFKQILPSISESWYRLRTLVVYGIVYLPGFVGD